MPCKGSPLARVCSLQNMTGCHLQGIMPIGGVAGCFVTPATTKQFDDILADMTPEKHYGGIYCTAAIVSIRPHPQTEEALKARGFVLLGKQKGGHANGFVDYDMLLYGKGFTLPQEP